MPSKLEGWLSVYPLIYIYIYIYFIYQIQHRSFLVDPLLLTVITTLKIYDSEFLAQIPNLFGDYLIFFMQILD